MQTIDQFSALETALDEARMNSCATRKSLPHQPSSPPPLLPDRRVLFHDDVIVHSFEIDGDDDNDDDVNRKRSSTPNVSQSHQKRWTERKKKRTSTTQSSDQTNICPGISNSSDANLRRKPPSSNSVPLTPEETNVRYNLVRDRLLRQILLQFSIPLGPMYGPKGVMVKANLHGTKIRVMACSKKPTTTADGQTVKMEYNETFPLPFAVDPNRVTARVDNLGYLLIGAPILRSS